MPGTTEHATLAFLAHCIFTAVHLAFCPTSRKAKQRVLSWQAPAPSELQQMRRPEQAVSLAPVPLQMQESVLHRVNHVEPQQRLRQQQLLQHIDTAHLASSTGAVASSVAAMEQAASHSYRRHTETPQHLRGAQVRLGLSCCNTCGKWLRFQVRFYACFKVASQQQPTQAHRK